VAGGAAGEGVDMRLRRILIRNFRNLCKVEIRPMSTMVIVGENNTGKSNLLHALRLLLDPRAAGFQAELSEDDINDAARAAGESWFSVTLEIGDLQKHQEVEAVFRDRIDQDGNETYVTIEGRYEPDDDGILTWKAQVLAPKGRYNDPIPLSGRMMRSIPLYYLDAVRDAARDTRATGRGLLAQLLGSVDFTDVQNEVAGYIRDANAALGRSQDIADLTEGMTKYLVPHIPGGQGEISIAVAGDDPVHLARGFRLHLRREPGARAYDISRHGTGLQNLVLVAMFRHRIASVESVEPILAIEEPEAHLHPHAQRRLFKDMDEIEGPVLLTTHSPAIVEHANPLSIVRLHASRPDEVTAHQLDPQTIDEDDLKLLARLMRGGRADAFFARVLIVVEGPSEVIALPAFADSMGYDLDRDCVSVVSADGNAYAFILRACQSDQFAIPTVVTYDTDVLKHDNKLLKEAHKAGLIDYTTEKSLRKGAPLDRQATLTSIGWIGADANFEEEICRAGYLGVAIGVIDSAGATGAMDYHLASKGLRRDAQGVALFLTETRKGKDLKVPVARAVADAVKPVGCVPDCYAEAIRRAVALASPSAGVGSVS